MCAWSDIFTLLRGKGYLRVELDYCGDVDGDVAAKMIGNSHKFGY